MAFIKLIGQIACRLTLLCSVGLFTSSVYAEQKVNLGSWEVHYIAINSTFLTPAIAKEYGIVRSKYNGLINISVLDKKDKSAQSLILTGEAKNLLGVVKKLSFKKVTEGEAIYYLAPLSFSDLEQYRITIDLNDGTQQHKLKFQHKFHAE